MVAEWVQEAIDKNVEQNENVQQNETISIENNIENIKKAEKSGKLKKFDNNTIAKYIVGTYTLYDPNHNFHQSSSITTNEENSSKKYELRILENGIFIVGENQAFLRCEIYENFNDTEIIKKIYNKIQETPFEKYKGPKQITAKTKNNEFCKVELKPIDDFTFENFQTKFKEYRPSVLEKQKINNTTYHSPKLNSNIGNNYDEESKIQFVKNYDIHNKSRVLNIDKKTLNHIGSKIINPPITIYKESKLIYLANKMSEIFSKTKKKSFYDL
jgi:hypothetical protein